MRKYICIAIMATILSLTTRAQDFAYQYHGQTLADGSTVTIEAEPSYFGEYECNTNPSDDNMRLVFKKLGNSLASTGSATITIEQNSLGTDNMQWCMGGNCVAFSGTTYTKDFDFSKTMVTEKAIAIQYDTEPKQYGEMLTKLVSTIGGSDYTLYIKFTYTDLSNVQNTEQSQVVATSHYNTAGQRVKHGQRGLCITRLSNGKVVKTLNL